LGARQVQFKEAMVEMVEDKFPERSRKGFVMMAGGFESSLGHMSLL
jgi:hypothetical protein